MRERAKAAGSRAEILAGIFPRREITIHGASERKLVLGPRLQALVAGGAVLMLVWTSLATGSAVLNYLDRDRHARELVLIQEGYETRLADAVAAQRLAETTADSLRADFRYRLHDLSNAQAELVRSVEAERARSVTLAAVRRKLADAVRSRDHALRERRDIEARLAGMEGDLDRTATAETELSETLGTISLTLAENIHRREEAEARTDELTGQINLLESQAKLDEQRLQRLLGRLEEAVIVSLGKLEGVLSPAGFDVEQVVAQLKSSYSGEGGPFIAVNASVTAFEEDPQTSRIVSLMDNLERVQLLGIAMRRLPFALPVRTAYRFTSGFGTRRDPRNHRVRQHSGIDLAATRGTPIYATGEGTVIYASRMSGYGKVIKIRHAFGVETLYAHLSAIRVKVGDRVARGDRIGDMGSTGRSTGTHLHYEIRVGGTPINPMRYLKAARNVL